jgi:hypothetical protein
MQDSVSLYTLVRDTMKHANLPELGDATQIIVEDLISLLLSLHSDLERAYRYTPHVISRSDRGKLSDHASQGEKLLRDIDLFVMHGCTAIILSEQDLFSADTPRPVWVEWYPGRGLRHVQPIEAFGIRGRLDFVYGVFRPDSVAQNSLTRDLLPQLTAWSKGFRHACEPILQSAEAESVRTPSRDETSGRALVVYDIDHNRRHMPRHLRLGPMEEEAGSIRAYFYAEYAHAQHQVDLAMMELD